MASTSYKILLVGPSFFAGKTCLTYRFTTEHFLPSHRETIPEYPHRTVEIDGKKIKLVIWNTLGGTSAFYRNASGIMLVYDITNEDFIRNKKWISEVEKYAPSDAVKMLVGNKCDLQTPVNGTAKQGRQLAKNLGMDFMEVSAKTGFNVDRAFYTLARNILTAKGELKMPATWLEVEDDLIASCQTGNFETVLKCLQKEGCNPNSMGYSTPLHYACIYNDLSALIELVDSCACDLTWKDIAGNTVLHIAAKYGHLSILRHLLNEMHCNPNDTNVDGQNCLHIACKEGHKIVIQYLLNATSCDFKCKDSSERTCLHWSCISGIVDVVKCLVSEKHCNPCDKDSHNRSCLHLACEFGHADLVDYLLTETDCCSSNSRSKREFLHQAFRSGLLSVVKYFSEEPCDKSYLHIACEAGYVDIVKYLVSERSCNPEEDRYGKSCLWVACLNENADVVEYLISHPQCDVNKKSSGESCLQWACRTGHVEIVKYLVNFRHCDVNDTNSYSQQNCLHMACAAGKTDVVDFLLGTKCDRTCKDSVERTCLHWACEAGSLYIVNRLVRERVCNPIDQDRKGQTCLHVACKAGKRDLVEYLLNETECGIADKDGSDRTGLHVACQAGQTDVVKYLINSRQCNLNDKNRLGQTCLRLAFSSPSKQGIGNSDTVNYLIRCANADDSDVDGEHTNCLQWACKKGHNDIVKYLISERHCNPTVTNSQGQTCLHIACQEGQSDTVEFLVSVAHCNPNTKDVYGQTSLHAACSAKCLNRGHVQTINYLIADLSCSVTERDRNGQNCLQWACEVGFIEIAEHLITKRNCNPDQDCLEKACAQGHVDIIQFLISNGLCNPSVKNDVGLTLLHIASQEGFLVGVVRCLIEEAGLDPACTDNFGQTPLHYATRHNHLLIVKYLCSTGKCDILHRDTHGNTALHHAQQMDIVLELISHGANPSEAAISIDYHLSEKPPDPSVSVFIVGYPSVGKSTLIKALIKEVSGLFVLPGYFRNVSTDPHTAGIIPTDYFSRYYGRVTFFDLAGQNQYYASHAAVIQNAISSAASVFLLVVNISEDIKQQVLYWLMFLENQCKQPMTKSHLIIVGSHADQSQTAQLLSIEEYVQICKSFTLIAFIPLDCRRSESTGMTRLRRSLKMSCDTLRQEEEMEFACHCLLVCLVQKLSTLLAISLKQLSETICKMKFSKGYNSKLQYEDFIRPDVPSLYQMCNKLHARGHILFLKNERNAENSWIILDKETLLSKITGTVFAPIHFKEYNEDLATSTGVVPLSKLAFHFPQLNTEMIAQFLSHFEFCHAVSDPDVLRTILTEQPVNFQTPEQYFFFPALVCVDPPPATQLWDSDPRYTYQSGWVLQCSQPEHFYTPRFLQVLLLRLAFSFALAPDNSSKIQSHLPVIQRKCSVWKNGIYWVKAGVASIVEMDKPSRELTVIMRCLNGIEISMHCVKLRSAIIQCILKAVKEFCPKVSATEYLVHPAEVHYPLNKSEAMMFSVQAVSRAVAQSQPSVVNHALKMVTVKELLYFEPYAYISPAVITELFDEQNPRYKAVVSDDFLYTIANTSHNMQDHFKELLGLPAASVEFYQSQAPPGSAHAMGHLLVCWKEHSNGSRQCLCQKFDEFSIFAGRNPLVSSLINCSDSTKYYNRDMCIYSPFTDAHSIHACTP